MLITPALERRAGDGSPFYLVQRLPLHQGMDRVLFHLCQIDGQVVGEPAVSCPETLRLGGLGVPRDAEAVGEGLMLDYPVVPDAELLLGLREVDLLGGEPQQRRIAFLCVGILAVVVVFLAVVRILDITAFGVEPEVFVLTAMMTAPFTPGFLLLLVLGTAVVERLARRG